MNRTKIMAHIICAIFYGLLWLLVSFEFSAIAALSTIAGELMSKIEIND